MSKLLYDYNNKTLKQFFNDKDVKREMCRSIAVNCGITSAPSAGNTASRPSSPSTGEVFFDSTLGYPIWYNGTTWVDSTGNPV